MRPFAWERSVCVCVCLCVVVMAIMVGAVIDVVAVSWWVGVDRSIRTDTNAGVFSAKLRFNVALKEHRRF